MSRTFCFQQNDTKINDFDEGVLIPEPFILRPCHFQNLLRLYQKSCAISHDGINSGTHHRAVHAPAALHSVGRQSSISPVRNCTSARIS